jgi:hypothetical protein
MTTRWHRRLRRPSVLTCADCGHDEATHGLHNFMGERIAPRDVSEEHVEKYKPCWLMVQPGLYCACNFFRADDLARALDEAFG